MSPKHEAPALPHQAQSQIQPTAAKPNWFLTILVIASIAVVILGIVLLKGRQEPAVVLSAAQGGSPAAMSGRAAVSNPEVVNGPFRSVEPADQLNQALAGGKPALVFMHSTTCQSCKDMMKVVDQVYPEFAGQVALVDVDVNDKANSPLMQKLGLHYIPTVVVFDSQGQKSQNVGLMKPDAFRTFLRQHALGG
jgi:thiol:disulfide interchange protein